MLDGGAPLVVSVSDTRGALGAFALGWAPVQLKEVPRLDELLAEMKAAVQSFMTAAHLSGADADSKHYPKVYHANGVPLMKFEWNKKSRAKAEASMHRILQNPPLCSEMETEKASIPFDARGRDGWDVDSMVHMTESEDEGEGEEDE